MKTTAYVIVDRDGHARLTKRYPLLMRGEIAIKVEIEVDDSAFRPPILEGSLTVGPEEAIGAAPVTFRVGERRRRLELVEAERPD